jgi:hypothetical protein
MSLDGATQALWNEYLALEDRGTREDRTAELERFVDAAKGLGSEITDAFAYDLARRKVDRNEDFALRMPLFREIVFPALKRGLAAGRGDCARWLAGLYQLVVRSADYLEIQAAVGSERELLVRALELDPTDKKSRRRLIESDANYLHFTLHELPSGVLSTFTDGATAEECLQLSEFVDEFEDHTKAAGIAADFHQLVERCRLHYRAYREYLLNRADASYAEFLARQGLAQ